jgi:hypothetical protein
MPANVDRITGKLSWQPGLFESSFEHVRGIRPHKFRFVGKAPQRPAYSPKS